MKRLKLSINSILLGVAMLLCFGMGYLITSPNVSQRQEAYAAGEEVESLIYDYTPEQIPYALVTQRRDGPDTLYRNYNYNGEYILLTSDSIHDADLYNTTIMVRFNIQRDNDEVAYRIPASSLNVTATLGDKRINVGKHAADPNNAYIDYRISFRSSVTMEWAEPGSPIIDPLERDGLYNFKFTYKVQTPDGIISDTEYELNISFNLLDKVDYLSSESAYEIEDANYSGETNLEGIDYPVYEFNYNNYDVNGNVIHPKVTYEANKFALNYEQRVGSASYNYQYSRFKEEFSESVIANPDFDDTKVTGTVVINKIGTTQQKTYNTYKTIKQKEVDDGAGGTMIIDVICPYTVSVDLTELGQYKFFVDIIISTKNQETGNVSYNVAKIPDLENSDVKYLINYGYQITYKDQATNKFKELRNEYTHADIAGVNAISDTTSFHIPADNRIPSTDQAPIQFNYLATGFNTTASRYKNYTSLTDAMTALEALTALPYGQLLADSTLDTEFRETSRFNKQGVYIVKACYSITTSINTTHTGIQLFAFQIKTAAPALVVEYDKSTGGTPEFEQLTSQYTNKSVRFKILNDIYSFNAAIVVKYTRYAAFNSIATSAGTYVSRQTAEDPDYYEYLLEGSTYSIPNSMNGRYIITVTYSPSRLNQYYQYIIDTSPIGNITLNDVSYETDGGYYIAKGSTIAQTKYDEDTYDISLTGNPFTISWKEKDWAAYAPDNITTKITAYFLPIINKNTNAVYYEDYDKTLTNGFETDTAAPLLYGNSYDTIRNMQPLTSKQYLSANGIYMFYVEDLAGNSFERIVMIDNSAPTFLQLSLQDNEGTPEYVNSYDMVANKANFVRTNTKLIFGKNKGIVYQDINTPENNLFTARLAKTSLFKSFPTNSPDTFFLNIPITSVSYMKDYSTTQQISNAESFALIQLTTTGAGVFAGEGYYEFTSYAKNGTTVFMYISMNFDGARGQFHMVGDDYGSTEERYVANNNGSNLHRLMFKYMSGTEATEVTRITYSYYPFNYLGNTPSYPFAEEPEQNKKDKDLVLPDKVEDKEFMYTISDINLENGKTAPGKYILTRYYYGGGYIMDDGKPVESEFGGPYDASGNLFDFGQDSYSRSYTIYVDHNGVITMEEQAGIRNVGDNISITIGKNTPNEYEFKNFFRNVSDGLPILTTNKLPIQINIPIYKYYLNSSRMSRLYYNNLDVVITYKNTKLQYAPTETYKITTSTREGFFIINQYQNEGTYTITISDRSGYNEGTQQNVNPMKYSCSFVVSHSYPQGDILLNGKDLEPSEFDSTTFATNAKKSETVQFIWQDAPDPYTASVVELNITAAGLDGTDTFNKNDYNLEDVINGITEFDLTSYKYIKNIAIEELSRDIFEDTMYHQYKFIITLNIDEEFDYDIEIRYASKDITDHGYGQYVSTNYRLKIDRTKPNINIDKLLEEDKFLIANSYYENIDSLKEKFKDEANPSNYNTSKPTIYDYSFVVDPATFSLTYNSEETISTFYFRKYSKYENSDSEAVNQSLTPDHPKYSDLSSFSNYPRFNPVQSSDNRYMATYANNGATRTLASIIQSVSGISAASLNGSFYEIIERDLAGNYRAFTVHFKPSGLYNILQLQGTTPGGQDFDISTQEYTTVSDVNLTHVSSGTGWGKLVVENITDPTKARLTLDPQYTPYLSTSDITNNATKINQYMYTTTNTRYAMTLVSSAGTSIKYVNVVKANTKLPMPDVVKTENGKYVMVFPRKTTQSVIYLTGLKIAPVNGGTPEIYEGVENIPAQSEEYPAGIFRITYYDNTPNEYSYQIHLGIDYVPTNEQFKYETNSSIDDGLGTTYTGGNIFITFQSLAHVVSIANTTLSEDVSTITINADSYGVIDLTNCITISGDKYYSISSDIYLKVPKLGAGDNGFRGIMLTSPIIEDGLATESVGGLKKYLVQYYYNNGDLSNELVNSYNFAIYNKLAGINLFDANGNPIAGSTTSSSMTLTSSSVKIQWEDLADDIPANLYKPVVVLNSLSETGDTISSIEISKNRIISSPGYYAVELCNTAFGNYRTVYFAIQDGEIPFYRVVDKVTGAVLNPSPYKLDIANNHDGTNPDNTLKAAILAHLSELYKGDTDKISMLTNKINSCSTNIDQYFSLNYCDLSLDASSDLYSEKIFFKNGSYVNLDVSGNSDYMTTIYLIYGNNNPIYANIIAVTKVPKADTSIVANKLYYSYRTHEVVSKQLNGLTNTIKNDELDNNSIHIYWNTVSKDYNTWYNRGNVVYLNYTFNNVTSTKNFGTVDATGNVIATDAGLASTITISGSGKHQLSFSDLAGNVSFFKTNASAAYSQNYYVVTILDKVIYTVNNATPLDYAVYNNPITMTVDTTYSNDYNINSLKLTVWRNGTIYENYIRNADGTSFTFSESGRYIVLLNASYKDTKPLDDAYYNFTIIDRSSARLAYEFNEMLGYEITKVYKNNVDYTDRVKQEYIIKEGLAVTPEEYSLKELFISPEKFGNGDYLITVAVKYNSLLAAKEFSFGFKISNITPVIMTNPERGGTTKKTITLTFNPSYIYQQIGKSSLVVMTYNSDTNRFTEIDRLVIDESSLLNAGIRKVEIKETNSYYFQLVTDNGNIITSFRITREEPLNALSIIIIVAASVTVVVLTIIFIKMRTKMKVK